MSLHKPDIVSLKRLIPLRIRRVVGDTFWWLWAPPSDDVWQWKQNLEILEKGGTLEPGVGLEEEKEYIRKQMLSYYGSFEGLKVLGAGCGTGRIEAWMASGGANVVCLDHLPEAVQISRIHVERALCKGDFVVGDLERMPFRDGTFDLINSGGVLEHLHDLKIALSEYFRVTRPNGVIVVSVPNLVGHNAGYGMKPLAELVLRNRIKSSLIEQDFSARKLRKIIQESGFRCLDISPTLFNVFDYFPFSAFKRLLSLIHIYQLYLKLLYAFGRRFPGFAFGYSFMIALAKRPEGQTR
jgi:2-polyprenyl-3-methyl-5-hydroxy-6-metoxy-1,4-benzoquinol methylase